MAQARSLEQETMCEQPNILRIQKHSHFYIGKVYKAAHIKSYLSHGDMIYMCCQFYIAQLADSSAVLGVRAARKSANTFLRETQESLLNQDNTRELPPHGGRSIRVIGVITRQVQKGHLKTLIDLDRLT